VQDAAGRLFIERGYVTTSIEAISAASDVPVATVYRLFESKLGILKAVLEVAFVGDDAPLALHDRPLAQQAANAQDPREIIDGFARLCREVLDRSAPLHRVLRQAAAVDDGAAELLATIEKQRLAGHTRVARALANRHGLADGVSEPAATDTIFAVMAPEVHRLLTVDRGWSADNYERWLGDTLAAVLLKPGARPPRRARTASHPGPRPRGE
jgi:AcrR family transcriptional regulator